LVNSCQTFTFFIEIVRNNGKGVTWNQLGVCNTIMYRVINDRQREIAILLYRQPPENKYCGKPVESQGRKAMGLIGAKRL
jgi:hypothetical protein